VFVLDGAVWFVGAALASALPTVRRKARLTASNA
jgi:prophage antirepressor-like protein